MDELLGLSPDEALRRAIAGPDRPDGGKIDALDAGDIETILRRDTATLMVRVDATDAAEIMPCDLGVPLVERELVRATGNPQALQRDPGHDRALSAADRAVAAPDVLEAVYQVYLELHGLAVAGSFHGLHVLSIAP